LVLREHEALFFKKLTMETHDLCYQPYFHFRSFFEVIKELNIFDVYLTFEFRVYDDARRAIGYAFSYPSKRSYLIQIFFTEDFLTDQRILQQSRLQKIAALGSLEAIVSVIAYHELMHICLRKINGDVYSGFGGYLFEELEVQKYERDFVEKLKTGIIRRPFIGLIKLG